MTINFTQSLEALSWVKTYLENLSDAELAERLAKLTISGKDVKARMEAGERGTVVSQHMERGRWCDTYSLESSLHGLRDCWGKTRLEQRRRAAAVKVAA